MTIYKVNRKQVVERNLVLRDNKSVKVEYANYMYQQYVLNHKKVCYHLQTALPNSDDVMLYH